MKIKKAAIAILLVSTNFCFAQDVFNFKYKGEGAKTLMPTQVFDNGEQTIFQFRPGQRIPAIFIDQAGEWKLVQPTKDGQYHYVPGVSAQFRLQIGATEGFVKYSGADRSVTVTTAPINSLAIRSYASVAKGDTFVWAGSSDPKETQVVFLKGKAVVASESAKRFTKMAIAMKEATAIDVTGYEVTSHGDVDAFHQTSLGQQRVDAIVNSLVAFGIDRSKIRTKVQLHGASDVRGGEVGARIEYVTAVALQAAKTDTKIQKSVSEKASPAPVASKVNEASKQVFRIEQSDQNIMAVINRWGREAGWRVIDVNFPHISLEKPAAQTIAYGSFLEAVERIKQGLHAKGYTSVDGKAYTDNVLEIGVFDVQK